MQMILGPNWIRRSRAILRSDGRTLGVTFDGKKEDNRCSLKDFCPSPYVFVDVDGMGTECAVVDTGSKVSYIHKDMLTELQKSKAIPTSRTTITGSGTVIKNMELVSLKITFQGITTCIKNVRTTSGINYRLFHAPCKLNKYECKITINQCKCESIEKLVKGPPPRE